MIADIVKGLVGFFFTMEEVEGQEGEVVKKRGQFHHRGLLALLASASAVFALWSLGMVPNASGFVLAGDLDRSIRDKLDPVARRVEAIDGKVSAQGEALNEVLSAITAAQINVTKRRICKTTDSEERARLAADLNAQLQKYLKYSGGTPYVVPPCVEL